MAENEPSVTPARLSQEEESKLLQDSQDLKGAANQLFGRGEFSQAIGEYDKAISSCPDHLVYEIAVLKSNIAACHLKLNEWKEAAESATAALDGLKKLLPAPVKPSAEEAAKDAEVSEIKEVQPEPTKPDMPDKVMESVPGEQTAEPLGEERKKQVLNIQTKALFRRAKAFTEQGGWANLTSAQKDYQELSSMQNLSTADRKRVREQLSSLEPQVNEAKEKEVGEMVGKLKELGNGILRPFGLSTDMFNFQKDEKTGGYNMSFGGSS